MKLFMLGKILLVCYLFKEGEFDCFTLMGLFTCLQLSREF